MTIDIKATGVDLTPALREYIEMKVGSLGKFVTHWELEGEIGAWVEVQRTSHHHHKGEVFQAVVDVKLPKKVIRAEAYHVDMRAAIDEVKDIAKREIVKFKELQEESV